jgi:hypothetical protein
MGNDVQIIQIIANIATTLGLIVAVSVFIVEVRSAIKERKYQSFLTLLNNYQGIVSERKKDWKPIKKQIRKNPKIAHEIDDKQNSISYLLIRINQSEPMYAIEHSLLDREIRSLNFLNELCRLALEDKRAMQILLLTDSHEISYYQNRLKELLKLYESQRAIRLFPKPRYDKVNEVDIKEYFG